MSRTLNLIDRLLARGRDLQKFGRDRDALRVFRQLAGLRELPPATAEETEARLGEIQLGRRRYRRARRHFAAALLHQPDNARYHYWMATAVDAEDTGDPQRAARFYRRSLQLDPHQPNCLLDYGLFNLRQGRIQAGLTCLRRAAEMAPGDPALLARAATGMRKAGRWNAARSLLRVALFRNPRDGRFRRLWEDFRYQCVARRQRIARRQARRDQANQGPVVLSFQPTERTVSPLRVGSRTVRSDGPAPLTAPHGPYPSRRSDQRHAQ